MIIVEPFGGLGNRIRVIASAITLCRKLNKQLTVVWNEDQYLNCSYTKLFLPSEKFEVMGKKKKYHFLKNTHGSDPYKNILAQMVNKLVNIDYYVHEDDFYNLIWTGKLNVPETVSRYKNVYFQTCQQVDAIDESIQYLKPVAEIERTVNEISAGFNAYTIGVHVRQTDNLQSVQNSPLNLFIDEMKRAVLLETETKFFLATDDLSIEQKLINIFGNRIITYKKDFSRQTMKGIQDAMIDLFSLSKTQKILGSYWSSYSEMASLINGTPLKILKSSDKS
jgi:hypothetical protein